MKGIILAGGSGTRLYPLTKILNKQLLPIYDKPMIYYPMSVLMLAGIKEILIISLPDFIPYYKKLFGDGSHLGLAIDYASQSEPNGIADSFIIGRSFVGKDSVTLILGDNVFFGDGLSDLLKTSLRKNVGATIFVYWVADPRPYGIALLNQNREVIGLEEKPKEPKSNWAVTGLYCYDNQVLNIAADLKKSDRGELEITDLNNYYLKNTELNVEFLGRGYAWLDTGTHRALLQASQFVETIESRQGFKIASIEEVALRMGFISLDEFEIVVDQMHDSPYQNYLTEIAQEFGSS